MNAALIVFAKVPVPGTVKTRLTPLLADAEAARLYDAFVRDTLNALQSLNVDLRLYVMPSSEAVPHAWAAKDRVSVLQQSGASLGERMAGAFVDTFASGYEHAVILGTDHPTLPISFVEQALKALQTPRTLCVGPSLDGGYYLLGMNGLFLEVFEDMTWSHSRVFSDTLQRASFTNAGILVLPEWYDVDTPHTLRRLLRDLNEPGCSAPETNVAVRELNLEDRLRDWFPG